jgi:hypothetical protein
MIPGDTMGSLFKVIGHGQRVQLDQSKVAQQTHLVVMDDERHGS